MKTLVFTESDFERLTRMPREDERETCFVCYVRKGGAVGKASERFLVREIEEVPGEAYSRRTSIAACVCPDFLVATNNKARRLECGGVIGHTHPGDEAIAKFSWTDDQGEIELARYFFGRVSEQTHFALVISQVGHSCRVLGAGDNVAVVSVGERLVLPTLEDLDQRNLLYFDRQVRAFGLEGQRLLQRLTVAIVGLGGTGSVTAHQLAHLGVRDFLLIDFDSADETNFNRLLGAVPAEVGAAKIDIAKRAIKSIRPEAAVNTVEGDIVDEPIAEQLKSVDFIFLCTDSHASRAVVNQLAYQYLVPCIDMGVSIISDGAVITYITGRVQLLAPGMACLTCANSLDANQIRREMMTPEQRQTDPYFVGHHEPQPAVISLNATVSSLAVTMFLGVVTSVPSHSRFLIYDAIRGSVRPTTLTPEQNCLVCSAKGALAKGDAWPLPVRKAKKND